MKLAYLSSCVLVSVVSGAFVFTACTVVKDDGTGQAPATPTATAAPTTASTEASPPTTMTCDDLCSKTNTVPGCATDPANIPACTEICKAMLAGSCKVQAQAELTCVAATTLKCKSSTPGDVDFGSCSGQQKDANDCFKALPSK
jgi:hypothetical protein